MRFDVSMMDQAAKMVKSKFGSTFGIVKCMFRTCFAHRRVGSRGQKVTLALAISFVVCFDLTRLNPVDFVYHCCLRWLQLRSPRAERSGLDLSGWSSHPLDVKATAEEDVGSCAWLSGASSSTAKDEDSYAPFFPGQPADCKEWRQRIQLMKDVTLQASQQERSQHVGSFKVHSSQRPEAYTVSCCSLR